ncbi:uncharacterized protein BROUX77_007355 [Berkeleyomyces rouxiae]|uniref:uncharacterized protein n=1 Tax=Berkeleyomyces rouxiae TaxID=2035830 RepID=UPI003B7738CA
MTSKDGQQLAEMISRIEGLSIKQQDVLGNLVEPILAFVQDDKDGTSRRRLTALLTGQVANLETKSELPKFTKSLPEREALRRKYRKKNISPYLACAIAMTFDLAVLRSTSIKQIAAITEQVEYISSACKSSPPPYTFSLIIRERDENTCVVSGLVARTSVCHIIPLSLSNMTLIHFGLFLEEFCPELSPWLRNTFPIGDTNIEENLLCLTPTLEALWRAARFTLEPVSHSKSEVTVRFWWMRDIVRQIKNSDAYGIQTDIFSYAHSGLPILSGDIVHLRSRNGIPGPEFHLLKIQYLMQIMSVLAHVTEPKEDSDSDSDDDDDDYDDSDDDDEYNLGFDTDGDDSDDVETLLERILAARCHK